MLPVRGSCIALAYTICLVGCIGTIGSGESAASPNNQSLVCTPDNDTPQVGLSPVRRLTNVQYLNTIKDLLGMDVTALTANFEADPTEGSFIVGSGAQPTRLQHYSDVASSIASDAVADLPGLLDCDVAAQGEAECAVHFVTTFGKKAFRRPLSDDEVAQLTNFYETNREVENFSDSIRMMLELMLQMPQFIYRLELGNGSPEGSLVALTDHEIANKLSYALWDTMPDAELVAAADAGELHTSEQIEGHARRLLAADRANLTIENFIMQWLRLAEVHVEEKDKPFPMDDLKEETRRFVNHIMQEKNASFTALLTANYTMLNSSLASFYGLPDTGEGWHVVEMDPAQRIGVLTHASIMGSLAHHNQSSPILRGVFVRSNVLCTQIPEPPADLNIMVPEPDDATTTRELFSAHRANPVCASCHDLIDPVGFGFENFDNIGKFRDSELVNGQEVAVDASGEIEAANDANGAFNDLPELMNQMASSNQVKQCFSQQYFRFATSHLPTASDACSVTDAMDKFVQSDLDIRELMIALTVTDAFRYKRVEEASP